ncbi:unnamed protein product [Ilex paraguariensis]|uniref:Uncharacterized protein n=1 Tax=Ilex paraguariensis TaxID=185542 RepID=A0ABC8RLT8_9AQUA
MAVSEEESSSTDGSNKSRSASNGAYYLAKTVLRGSVVLQVVHGHFRSPSSNDIVFGKWFVIIDVHKFMVQFMHLELLRMQL